MGFGSGGRNNIHILFVIRTAPDASKIIRSKEQPQYSNYKNLVMKNSIQKKVIQITAVLDQPKQLETLVEKRAYGRYESGYTHLPVPCNWQAVEPSSTEIRVTGFVTVDYKDRHLTLPFTTAYLFTCLKRKYDKYRMAWGLSLS
jgi:hypothetical protein